jgi:adenylosuccinate synthase
MVEEFANFGHRLEPHIAETSLIVHNEIKAGKQVVFEGAQGALLDIDHGTYPFVTSSNPIAGAACVGAGIGPTLIDEVWGIAKAYTTRVGSGPFPSEIDNDVADKIRDVGAEFGTTTGRARRIGWLDLVALKYATRLNGLTGLCLTKLDVLSGIETLRVATSYSNADGATFDEFPYHQSVLHHSRAEYVDLPGWDEDITKARTFEDLPQTCRDYLTFVSDFLDVPIVLVGVGPERTQVITAGALAEQLA